MDGWMDLGLALKGRLGMKSDAELACFLVDRYTQKSNWPKNVDFKYFNYMKFFHVILLGKFNERVPFNSMCF